MSGFQPRVPPAPPPRPRAPTALIAAVVVALAAVGFLVLGGDDSSDGAGPAAPRAGAEAQRPDVARATPYATPAEEAAPAEAETAAALGKALTPAPQRAGGYVVSAADAPLLAGTPLRAGDVLLEIDGQKLDPARMERLAEELGRYEDVWVSFERDGKHIETLLELK